MPFFCLAAHIRACLAQVSSIGLFQHPPPKRNGVDSHAWPTES
jgi:hypothetical protein